MSDANILVIAVDGLRVASLGAYGNTWYATPALDRLAAESFVFDSCFAQAIDLPVIYDALWRPPSLGQTSPSSESPALPRLLEERGYASTLVTDDAAVLDLPQAADFGDIVQLSGVAAARADDVLQTSLANVFAAACQEIESVAARRLMWVHARGFYGPWDAPLVLQESLMERAEGDPPPCDQLEPPDFELGSSFDPDTVFRWTCAYAAQTMVLDACIAAVLESLESSAGGRWLVVLLGVRGFPLGEHGRVGGIDGRLYAEQVHVPMMWRFPDGVGRLARSANLVSHVDLAPTILAWTARAATTPAESRGGENLLPVIQGTETVARRELIAVDSVARSVRTSDWALRCASGDVNRQSDSDVAVDSCELYVRPDDRWDANDVAVRCPDVVEELTARLPAAAASTPPAFKSQ